MEGRESSRGGGGESERALHIFADACAPHGPVRTSSFALAMPMSRGKKYLRATCGSFEAESNELMRKTAHAPMSQWDCPSKKDNEVHVALRLHRA